MDKRITSILIASKEIGCGFPTEVAVDTLLVYVKFAGDIFRPLIIYFCHKL